MVSKDDDPKLLYPSDIYGYFLVVIDISVFFPTTEVFP